MSTMIARNRQTTKLTSQVLSALLRKTSRAHSTTTSSASTSSSTSSADPSEIAHFDKLAATWWAPHGPSKLLHQMNPLRHDFIRACRASSSTSASSAPPQRKNKYLDVGCGGGIFAESAARLVDTESVLAVDPSSEVIKIARSHARGDPLLRQQQQQERISESQTSPPPPSSSLASFLGRGDKKVSPTPSSSPILRYENLAIEDLPVPRSTDEQFDILTLFEVIEHVERPGPFLERCMPFVKPGGWIVLSTIARSWVSWVTTKVVAEDVIGLVPRGTHDWEKYVNEDELRSFFKGKDGWAGGKGGIRSQGVVYVPGFGWQNVSGSESFGNYFFGVRRDLE